MKRPVAENFCDYRNVTANYRRIIADNRTMRNSCQALVAYAFVDSRSNRKVINYFQEQRHLLFLDPKRSETRFQVCNDI